MILISGAAAFYLINNKPAEKKQTFDVDIAEEISTNDSIVASDTTVASDSIIAIDNTNLDQLENEELKVKFIGISLNKSKSILIFCPLNLATLLMYFCFSNKGLIR